MHTASYLYSKWLSTAIEENTLEKFWSGKEIAQKHLKIFGCRAWSHLRSSQRRNKFDPKAIECVLVGYPDGIKGYKLWDLKKKKFLISRDVIFEEDVFPFKSQPNLPNDNNNKVTFTIEDEGINKSIYQPETKTNEYNDTKRTSSNVHEINQSLESDSNYPDE